ncbi:MAG: hypothetical protein ACFFDT_12450 [Candidatus Hodarchaeota archaeon]
MLKERKTPILNYRFRNWGVLILLLLSIVQGISVVGISGDQHGSNLDLVTNIEELCPEEYQNLPGSEREVISDEEFATAEIVISIAYNLTTGLEITVGVEEAAIGFSGNSSRTGLTSVASCHSSLLYNDKQPNPVVAINRQPIRKTGSPCNLTTVRARIQDLGFSKTHLKIKSDVRHWYVTIKDTNVEKPQPLNRSENYWRPVGWLESFTITVGETRYSCLLHPFFAAGWEVTAHISGRTCQISDTSSQTAGGGASVHPIEEDGVPLYGIAGIIGVAYFDTLGDLNGIKSSATDLVNLLEETGIWEIYYMITDSETDDIHAADIIECLEAVEDAIGSPACVEHCFWFVGSHGAGYTFLGDDVGMVASSKTTLLWDIQVVHSSTLANIIEDITDKDVWFFFWMHHCHSEYFAQDYWESSAVCNNRALFWCYTPLLWVYGSLSTNPEVTAFIKHVTYGQKSCQWMFDGSGDDHTYENYEGGSDKTVDWVEFAYEDNFDTDMQEYDTMEDHSAYAYVDGYEFCLVPNTAGWVPTCRTRGEPCEYSYELSKWQAIDHSFMLEAKEVGVTFQRYVGFYKRVYLPSGANGGNQIFIELDARAKSDYSYSYYTNLRARIYSSDWQTLISSEWLVVYGGFDTGWKSKSHTFSSVPTGSYYNVLLYYNDGWNWNYDHQIFMKNIYLGNVVTDDRHYTAFERVPLDDGWEYVSGPGEFIRDSSRKISYSYSGHHDGGSGSVYRVDKWVTPGVHTDCTLTGWVYSDHYNKYSRACIYLVYAASDTYVRLRFYKDIAVLERKTPTSSYSESTSLGEDWNRKWWQFEVTVDRPDTHSVFGWVRKGGGSKITLNDIPIYEPPFPYTGYVALESRVGSYGAYWYDDLEVWW